MNLYIQHKLLLLRYRNNGNTRNNSLGFTLLEVIASSVMGLILLAFAFSGFLSMRQSFVGDTGAADVNQRLKTIFASIGPDMQQIGEGLTDTSLPLVEISQRIIPATSATPARTTSDITLRRTVIPQSLTLCENIAAGSTTAPKVIDDAIGNCKVDDNEEPKDGWPDTLKLWRDKRINTIGSIRAYIYDSTNKKGEFFDYKGEVLKNSTGTTITTPSTTGTNKVQTVTLDKGTQTWTNDYPAGSVIYLMDKRQYKVEDNKLKLIVNDTETFELTENMDKLDITATLQKETSTTSAGTTITTTTIHSCTVLPPVSGSCTPSFVPTVENPYNFNQIKSIEVKAKVFTKEDLDSDPNNQRKDLRNQEDKTMSQKFFLRNTLN